MTSPRVSEYAQPDYIDLRGGMPPQAGNGPMPTPQAPTQPYGWQPGTAPQGVGPSSSPPTPPSGGPRTGVILAWFAGGLALILAITLGVILVRDRSDDTGGEDAGAETFVEPEDGDTTADADAVQPEETVAEEPADTEAAAPDAATDDVKGQPGAAADAPLLGGVDAQAAGVDLSWLLLPEAAPYADWGWVVDDNSAITVQVPTAWTEVDGGLDDLGGTPMPSIWAGVDLEALTNTWSSPGMIMELRSGPTVGTTADVLEDMGTGIGAATSCETVQTYAYDDSLYAGDAAVFDGCGADGTAMLHIAAAGSHAEGVIAVQVQMATTADIEAAVGIIQSFQHVAEGSAAVVPAPAAPAPAAPAPAAPVAPAPAPAPAPATNSLGMEVGLFCRDLMDMGYSYAFAMDYYYAEGSPDRMDADLDGVPCETVYPGWEIDEWWGFGTTTVPPADESWEAMNVAENAMYACGYSPALDTYVDGPFADGGYTVSMTVDVGWDLVWAQFEVFPWSGEIYGFDGTADDLLFCTY